MLRDEQVLAHLRSTLSLLLQAYTFAGECERDVWDFAVEMDPLQRKLSPSSSKFVVAVG